MQFLLIPLVLLISLVNPSNSFALELSAKNPQQDLTSEIQYFEDRTGQLTFEDITKKPVNQEFKLIGTQNKIINLGNSKSTFWFKFSLKKSDQYSSDWILDIPNSRLGEVTFYGLNAQPIRTGAQLSFDTRPYGYKAFAFPLNLAQQPHDYFLQVKSDYLITLPIQVRTINNFYEHNQKILMIQATYFSAILIICFFSGVLFLRTRDKMFLFYTLFILSFGLAMFAKQGFGRVYFWQDSNHFDVIAQNFFTNIACLFAILFSRQFLNTSKLSRRIDRLLMLSSYVFMGMALLLALTIYFPIPNKLIFASFPIFTQLSVLIILYAIWRANIIDRSIPKLFNAAWIMLMLGATLSNLRAFSLIPSNDLTVNSVQIFSAIEILLWSIALINTFFEERKLKDEAVKIALSAKELLIENQKNTQDYLEREVRKRTQELQDAIAKEKSIRVKHMRFGAMISHEFRNPLAIIDAQITMILKEQLPEKQSLSRRVSTITAASNRLHRLFDKWIKNDQINMLHEEIDLAKLDIYDLIESIFNKCKGLYPEHEFVLNCDKKNKHMISANQDWLEMAITNLVDNACKYSKQQSQIRIECIQENSNTVISVIDHGIGIAPEFHGKIFNEYYRVNSNGATAGIGLGLSLVKKIVELHHASVDFVSSPGKGTTFRITFKNLSSNSSS